MNELCLASIHLYRATIKCDDGKYKQDTKKSVKQP